MQKKEQLESHISELQEQMEKTDREQDQLEDTHCRNITELQEKVERNEHLKKNIEDIEENIERDDEITSLKVGEGHKGPIMA
jgi:predicted nuclease with TOPRIM domain